MLTIHQRKYHFFARKVLFFMVAFLGLVLGKEAGAQTIDRWYMHPGSIVSFGTCYASHGDVQQYNFASIPAWPGAGWRLAPNPNIVGYSKTSVLCGVHNCRCGGEFTYFRNVVSIPANFNLTTFEIELRGMDDGTRVTIYNSRYPTGITPPNAYVFLGQTLSQDLRAYAAVGEDNVILLTHVDDCCQQSNLNEAYIRVNGQRVPVCQPQPEQCNNQDDDCNGLIDDGLSRACSNACGQGSENCQAGQWVGCTAPSPQAESCNGQDDDCDGKIDEGFPDKGGACEVGQGECVNGGSWICKPDGSGLQCDASPKAPQAEVCDNKDNNCDGLIDNDVPPRACQTACGAGTQACQAGQWGACNGPAAEPEICDGKDNDCNGVIDDMLQRACQSACGQGTEICRNGTWAECNAPLPTPEVCDGKDNDCNGMIDDNATCPQGMVCLEGRCRLTCQSECPRGMTCQAGRCEGDPCSVVTCGQGERCLNGRCVDACLLVSCPADQPCQDGACSAKKDCYTLGCPSQERCVGGRCEPDPCAFSQCPQGEFCRDGRCVSTCAGISCAPSERCVDGACEADPQQTGACAGVTCPDGERCVAGVCEAEPCRGVACPQGQRCEEGACTHDPCLNIRCPAGQVCFAGQCYDPSQAPDGAIQPDGSPSEGANESPSTDGSSQEPTGDGGGGETQQPEGLVEQLTPEANEVTKGESAQTEVACPNGRCGQAPGCMCDTTTPQTLWPFALLLLLAALVRRRRRVDTL